MEYLKSPLPTPQEVTQEIRDTVSTVIADVAREGTPAVRRYSERFTCPDSSKSWGKRRS